MNDLCNRLGVAALAAFGALSAVATTYYVDNKLDDYTGHDGSSWEKACLRIQDAVEKAKNGDVVLVARGTYGDEQGVVIDNQADGGNSNYSYRENRIWINNKHITLRSEEGAAVTHIVGRHSTDTTTGVGSNCVRCIALSGNTNIGGTRIEGFTIRDGATLKYGTGKAYNKTTGAIVGDCQASHRGGGVMFNYISGGNASNIFVVDCVISNCVAGEGAATYGVSLLRTLVANNRTDREGGSATVQGHAANCIFDGNGGVNYEGCMTCGTDNKPIYAVNCTFFNNKGIMRCSNKRTGAVFNCLIQRNGKTASDGTSIVTTLYGGITNCVTDVTAVTDVGKGNYAMADRKNNAQLVAPLFGDFRPVAEPATPHLFGAGDKAYCQMSWIPSGDQNKDFAGNARWDDGDEVTAGAYQQGVDVAGGCLTISCGSCPYYLDGRYFTGPDHGYFYVTNWPTQHRIRFVPEQSVVSDVWLGGYREGFRIPDVNGDVFVMPPPKSSDAMLCAQVDYAKKVLWADANYTGGDSDGTEEKPFVTLQAAVNAAPTGNNSTVIKVKPGVYDQGGGDFWGLARVRISSKYVVLRSTEGAEKTFIVGANGENPDVDGNGTNAYRCVSIEAGDKPAGLVGFTLTGGRTCTNGQTCNGNCRNGGGFFSNGNDNAQLLDSVISNCVACRASAAYRGWLQNCRILGCRQSRNPSVVGADVTALRGVFWRAYLSGCVIGPNSFSAVSLDQESRFWNCTVQETSSTQHLSSDAFFYNVLDLNVVNQPSVKSAFVGCALESSDFSKVSLTNDCLKLADAKIAGREAEDFRPEAGSAVLGAGEFLETADFVFFTVGGFYKDCLVRDGKIAIGATSETAIPVTLTKDRGIEVEGGLGTPYVSEGYPLTLKATRMDRGFDGFKVNGELVTDERTVTLRAAEGVSAFEVEPLYQSLGLILLFR